MCPVASYARVAWLGGGGGVYGSAVADGRGGLEHGSGGESRWRSRSVEEWTERRPVTEVGVSAAGVACRVVGEIRETRIRCGGGGVRLLVGVEDAGEEGEAEGTEEGVPSCEWWRDGDSFSTTVQVQVQGGSGSIVDPPPLGRRPSASLDRDCRRAVFRLERGREEGPLAELVAEDEDEDEDDDGGGGGDDVATLERSFVPERAVKGCADSAGLRRSESW